MNKIFKTFLLFSVFFISSEHIFAGITERSIQFILKSFESGNFDAHQINTILNTRDDMPGLQGQLKQFVGEVRANRNNRNAIGAAIAKISSNGTYRQIYQRLDPENKEASAVALLSLIRKYPVRKVKARRVEEKEKDIVLWKGFAAVEAASAASSEAASAGVEQEKAEDIGEKAGKAVLEEAAAQKIQQWWKRVTPPPPPSPVAPPPPSPQQQATPPPAPPKEEQAPPPLVSASSVDPSMGGSFPPPQAPVGTPPPPPGQEEEKGEEGGGAGMGQGGM